MQTHKATRHYYNLLLASALFTVTHALQCYYNVDTTALNAMSLDEQIDKFLSYDLPMTDMYTATAPPGTSCLVGQTYPRGLELLSRCVHFHYNSSLPTDGLVYFNLLAGTCDSDNCNADCHNVPSWAQGRKINVGVFMIILAFAIIAIGYAVVAARRCTDPVAKRSGIKPAADELAVVVSSTSGKGADTKDDAPTRTKKATFRDVYSLVSRAEVARFLLGCFCMAAVGMAIPFMSWNFGRSIGNLASADGVYEQLSQLCLILVYLAAGQLVLASIGYAILESTSVRVAQLWREKYLAAVLRQDIGWFDINRGGGVLAKMAEDTSAIQRGTGIQIGLFLMNAVSTVGALILAFAWAGYWNVALICLSVVPLLVASSAIMLATNERMSKLEGKAFSSAGALSSEAITSIRTVQAINAQDDFLHRFREALVPAERASLLKVVANGCSIGGINASFMMMYLVAGLYIAFLVSSKYDETGCNLDGFESFVVALGGNYTDYPPCVSTGRDGDTFVGDILATLFNIAFAGMGLGQIGEPMQKVVGARTAVYKILEVISRIPPIDSSSDDGLKPEAIEGSVEISNVEFAYPSRPDSLVARGLSLSIQPGQTVALVGPSGSGKSTVMALVQRYYDPLSGTVTIGGHDVRDLNVKFLRSKIGLVGQEPVLFAGSFLENIMYGSPGHQATEEEVIAAAKLANAHGFISKLEHGYHTDVGAGGSKISGGQKQRVAIARAIIRKPKILLLDEATSALDNESERVVQAALTELTDRQKSSNSSTTTIVIAHRLSTIVNSDRILVIKDGGLFESGTHKELLAQKGLYNLLWKKQEVGGGGTKASSTKAKVEEVDDKPTELAGPVPGAAEADVVEDPAAKKKRLKEEAKKAAAEASKAKGRIWAMQKDDKLYIVGGFFGAIANGLVFPVMAVTFAGMLFMLLNRSSNFMRSQSYVLAGMFGVISLVLCIPSAALQFYGFGKAGERLTTRIRVMVFEKMLRTEIGYFDLPENGTGDLSTRIASAASNVKALTGEAAGRNISMLCMMLFGPFLAISYSYHLVLALFFVMPFLMAGQVVFLAIMQGQFGKDSAESPKALNLMQEALVNVRTVVSIQLEDKLSEWYAAEGRKTVESFKEGLVLFSLVFAGSQGLQFLAWAFLFWFAALSSTHEQPMGVFIFVWAGLAAGGLVGAVASAVTTKICDAAGVTKPLGKPVGFLFGAGAAAAVISLGVIHVADDPVKGINFYEVMYGLFVSVFSTFGMANAQIGMTDAQVAAKSVLTTFGFLDKELAIDGMDDETGLKPDDLKGAIECKAISFSYPSRPDILVADGFDLSVGVGETVALVGQSGCGKSTTVLLLERFYDPNSGAITLDGYNLKDLNVRFLRKNIGLVGQEPVLFVGSIFSNIAKGLHGEVATQEQVERAARLANAHDFISSLEHGYHTDVGERGNQLSGGQKQRVAIARAIISNPKVLLLDEATSALDNESEKVVQAALDELLKTSKRTTLVIAHRLSTIRNADRICFIQDGKVAEQGTHDALISKRGSLYADMVAAAH